MTGPLAAGVVGGLLLAFSFPAHNLDLLAWIACVPFLWGVHQAGTPSRAAFVGMVFGWAFFLYDVSWVYDTLVIHGHFAQYTAAVMYVAMATILASVPALFGYVLKWCSLSVLTASLAAPFLWVALEYGRSVIFGGFPWDLTGYSQINRLLLVQIADITGVYGISFVIITVNAAVWATVELLSLRRGLPWTPVFVAVGLVTVTVVYGYNRLSDYPMNASDSGSGTIGILQGNVEQKIKWTDKGKKYAYKVYERLGSKAVKTGADLVVWPETSVPSLFVLGKEAWKRTSDISKKLGVPMLIGAPSRRVIDNRVHFYNSAFLVDGPKASFRYDKIHLVPFGEYMPLSWLLPFGPGIAARQQDYTHGSEMTVMAVDGVPPFGVLICYEAVFPELARRAVRNGADMLVNITNDGWFGFSAAPYQHLNMARLRSIENRAWFLRAANTGVSAIFDPAGREQGSIPYGNEGLLMARVPRDWSAGSPYSRFGDVFALLCVLASVVMCITVYRFPGRRS
jgi:apolipoprotein N-acyltransferase